MFVATVFVSIASLAAGSPRPGFCMNVMGVIMRSSSRGNSGGGPSCDGEVDMLVQWRGHDDTNNTWEPLSQLVADVPALVTKYVKENAGWPDLEREYKKAVRSTKTKKKT